MVDLLLIDMHDIFLIESYVSHLRIALLCYDPMKRFNIAKVSEKGDAR